MPPTPQSTTTPAVLETQQASRAASAVGLRRLAPVLVYAAVLLWAAWYVDCRSLWILFGVAPVLLLDQYFGRLLPWPEPRPKASALLPRAAIAVIGGVGCYLCNRPYVYFWDTLFIGVVLTLGVSLIGSMVDLGSALWRLWRKQPNGPPGRLAAAVAVFAIVLAIPASAPLLFFHLIHQPPHWTPADDGYEFEEVTVTAGDGLALSGWLIPCPDAVGSVIYCHGHGSNRTQIRPLVPLFRSLRLNVLAFDFRGHGASPGHTATFGAREVEDVIGADRFLRERFPDQPIVLCGISYGASICVQALPRLPHVRRRPRGRPRSDPEFLQRGSLARRGFLGPGREADRPSEGRDRADLFLPRTEGRLHSLPPGRRNVRGVRRPEGSLLVALCGPRHGHEQRGIREAVPRFLYRLPRRADSGAVNRSTTDEDLRPVPTSGTILQANPLRSLCVSV
jgi:pimeloyl-ACP methyl ester carboxylesterase